MSLSRERKLTLVRRPIDSLPRIKKHNPHSKIDSADFTWGSWALSLANTQETGKLTGKK